MNKTQLVEAVAKDAPPSSSSASDPGLPQLMGIQSPVWA